MYELVCCVTNAFSLWILLAVLFILILLMYWMFRPFFHQMQILSVHKWWSAATWSTSIVLNLIVRLNAAIVLCSVLMCTNDVQIQQVAYQCGIVCLPSTSPQSRKCRLSRRDCKSKNANSHCYKNNIYIMETELNYISMLCKCSIVEFFYKVKA